MRTGRPTLFTPDVVAKVVAAVRAGNYRETAAAIAGVSVRTLKSWTRRGKDEAKGPYKDFLHAVLKAEAQAEILQVRRLLRAAAKDPRHAAWWLERKFPQRWGSERGELKRLRKELEELRKAVNDAVGRTAPAGIGVTPPATNGGPEPAAPG